MNSIRLTLAKFVAKQQLVTVRRPFGDEMLEGCLVGLGNEFVLLHNMECGFRLHGHIAVRTSDIRDCRALIKNDRIAERVLKLRGDQPIPLLPISLDSIQELLPAVHVAYPLVTIHTEMRDPDVCFIGKVAKITDKTVTLDEIDPAAKWSRTRRFRLKEITRVDIGGVYEDALLLAANQGRPQGKLQKPAR